MKGTTLILATCIIAAPALAIQASAHCQIPCGIFDDEARFAQMLEDVQTIEKSMVQIQTLSGTEKPDWNQLVRWVNNKEEHADKLSELVTFYFMAQRVKPAAPEEKDAYKKYLDELTLLHQVLVNAMKAKQTVDPSLCKTLRDSIEKLRQSYLRPNAPK